MKTFNKLLLALLFVSFVSSCTNTTPNGWSQKVNNRTINRIVIKEFTDDKINCAQGEKAHVKCNADDKGFGCVVIATFNDGSPQEEWAGDCDGGYIVFDDGTFTYFYGTKQP